MRGLKESRTLNQAVVKVSDGRGFVVKHHDERVIITAAHCLPTLPPAHPWSHLHERTYQKLLGPLGGEPTIWAECQFADPIADIAVLGTPDNQDLSKEAEAYEDFVASAAPLTITDPPKMGRERVKLTHAGRYGGSFWVDTPGRSSALSLSLEGKWLKCTVLRRGRGLTVEGKGLIDGGMSGSPILSADGKAIGLISTDELSPILTHCLPAWFFG